MFPQRLVLRVLEHQTRQETEIPDLFRLGPEVAAINDDLAAGGFVQTVHVGDEGALAGAGGSDDAHEIALFHLKAHVVQRGDCVRHTGVVDIAQVFYFDNACHVSVPPYFSSSYRACAHSPVSMMPSGMGMPALTSSSRSSAACGTSRRRERTFSVWLNTSFGCLPSPHCPGSSPEHGRPARPLPCSG